MLTIYESSIISRRIKILEKSSYITCSWYLLRLFAFSILRFSWTSLLLALRILSLSLFYTMLNFFLFENEQSVESRRGMRRNALCAGSLYIWFTHSLIYVLWDRRVVCTRWRCWRGINLVLGYECHVYLTELFIVVFVL